MPTRLIRRIDLDKLMPGMVTPLLEVLAECAAHGKHYVAISGLRSFGEQAKLWTYGRTLKYTPDGKPLYKVTDAQAGFSTHNYGLAVDVCLDGDNVKPGLQPIWTNDEGEYNLLKTVGEKWGFQVGVPGIKGGDPGHIQIPLARIYEAREHQILGNWKKLVRERGEPDALKSIWDELDRLWPIDRRIK